MAKVKIYGKSNPVVGVKEYYSIHELFGNSISVQPIPANLNTIPDDQIKWSIWTFNGSSWTKKEAKNKTGAIVDYTFFQDSLNIKGIRIKVDANGEIAVLDIKTQKAVESKILFVELLDSNGKKPEKLFSYGQSITARVHCVNMERFPVTVTLWEDDGGKTANKNTDITIDVQKGYVLNGKADVTFYLDPKNVWLANVKQAPGDTNEGAFHEYYVTAELYEKVSKPSKNINVINPDYKKDPFSKASPAEKKGPSKKEQKKEIPKTDQKVRDYEEQKIVVQTTVSYDPEQEFINSLMMVNVGDPIWNKDHKKGGCDNCVAEVKVDQLQPIFPDADFSVLEKVANTYTKYMKEFGMDTCWNKAHFFAQAIVESGSKLVLHEGESMNYLADDLYLGRWDPEKKKYNIILSYFKTHKDEAYKYGRLEEIKNNKKIITQKANPEMIANLGYGPNSNKGRELGNTKSTDGWNFRGKGLIQLTGRSAYEFANTYTKKEGADIISNSDLVSKNVSIAVLSSMAFWKWKNIAPIANGNKDTKNVCKKVGKNVTLANGKTNHDEKQVAFKNSTSVIFNVKDCKYGKVQNDPIPGKAPWMPFALKEIGQKAILGSENNSRITEYFNASTNGKGLNEGTNWCGAFASWCFTQAGYTPPALSCRAAMWQFWKQDKPIYGSAAVIDWNDNQLAKENGKNGAVGGDGHITFVVGISEDGKHYYCVGGNQGGAKGARTVKISKYSKKDIDWFVIPPNYIPTNEEYKLKVMNSEADLDTASSTRT
ncbi:hypothetical protein HYN56_13505 [Flavobacterium crocinum]|uniref:Peptidase C51 domain-containing protein n=1 Tax=Flavobacterium crocinum TaxID=2183896 RepID=A0A2S1YME2_9FLAO|nr:hypothetical protein [Flavobacterium crocinum]AWK05192.1 hypothetical protein HYN56_13505 [Flavobacterium crocinum]